MWCLSCQYDLTNLVASEGEYRCPECGKAFDPNDVTTSKSWIQGQSGRLGFLVALALFFVFVLVMIRVYGAMWFSSIDAIGITIAFSPFICFVYFIGFKLWQRIRRWR